MEAATRAQRLKLMAFDVDGVMTDGTLYFSDDGVEMKGFNSQDGAGLKMLMEAGVAVAIITGRKARCVELRAENLGIRRLHQGVHDKAACMQSLLQELGISAEEAGYMGDDIMDLPVMNLCGFSAAPADAHGVVLRHAALITRRGGGRGAVREACDFILKAQGQLDAGLARYLPAAG